jgi:hypothetical protein
MQHCIAWSNNAINNVETDMTPVTDSIIAIQNGHYMPQRDTQMVWAFFANADADRMRLASPTLRQITTPFLRPVNGTITPEARPGVADYRQYPLTLKGLEELQVFTFQNGAGAARSTVLMGIADGPIIQAPNGQIYTLRGTGTTAVTANAWTGVTITWQDNLPAGRYAAVGLLGVSATCVGTRLVFEDTPWRPGSVGSTDTENPENMMFRMGNCGVLGTFTGNRMPNVEMICTSADASQEIYLDLMKIG